MTTQGVPGGFFNRITDTLNQISKSGVFWGGVISAGDPEWRAMAEHFAFWLRERFNVEFQDAQHRRYAERIFAAMRGSLERVINKKLRREAVAVVAEKILIDMPDFAASILFADAEEFALRRALRARQLVQKGSLTQHEMEMAEEAVEPLYDDVLSILADFAKEGGQSIQPPSTNPWKGSSFQELLHRPQDAADPTIEVPVHDGARALKEGLQKLDKAMGERLLRLFHLNPDPELDQQLRVARDERDRANSRRSQSTALAKIRDETNRFNADADRAAGVLQDVDNGLPINKATLYDKHPKKRWWKRNP